MKPSIELLAPAGDFESLKIAVEYGADAVYLGAKNFSARQSATNFDTDELEMAIDYAHVRDAKVYVAMNTIISDLEMGRALEDACSFYNMGADGIIIQDVGFASSLSLAIPDINIHASTQMTIYDSCGVQKCKEMGFSRVVLARELSLGEIQSICKNTDIEIEVFVHGALCISYSGQCLFSSLIGGRSGNRGKCAQPCRLPYEIYSKKSSDLLVGKGHLLSPKDLCTLSILPKIINSGVKSLKIEGRMKGPQYVGCVVDTYRRYIDIIENGKILKNQEPYEVQDEDIRKLSQVFNRGGFTTGYLEGITKNNKNMMSVDSPKNQGLILGVVDTYDASHKRAKIKIDENISIGDGVEFIFNQEVFASTIVTWISKNGRAIKEALRGDTVEIGDIKGKITKGMTVYKTSDKSLNISITSPVSRGKSLKKILLDGEIDIFHGKEIVFKLQNKNGDKYSYRRGEIAEESFKNPTDASKVIMQLKKTGDTPFEFDNITVNTDGISYVSSSALNSARRNTLEGFSHILTRKQKRNTHLYSIYDSDNLESQSQKDEDSIETAGFSLYLFHCNNFDIYENIGAKRVYIPISKFNDERCIEGIKALKTSGTKVFMAIPVGAGAKSREMIMNIVDSGRVSLIDGVLISNLGQISHVKELIGDIKIVSDYTFNVFNSNTAQSLFKQGVSGITYSAELNLGLLQSMRHALKGNSEIIAYGRMPVMNTKYCTVGRLSGSFGRNVKCLDVCSDNKASLKDRTGKEFPIISDKFGCHSIILNSKILYIPDEIKELSETGIKTFRINVFDETRSEILDIIKIYSNSLGLEENRSFSQGGSDYNRIMEKLVQKGITKGHLFRGV